MEENSLVSVIMSVYNEKSEWLSQAIESVLQQSYKNIEFIIILDNPLNEKLKKIIQNYAKCDDRIKVLINSQNIGLVDSLNKALNIASGEYIARMDADDISFRDRLKIQKNFLEENKLDFVGSNVISFNSEGEEFLSNYPLSHKKIISYSCDFNPMAHPTWFLKKKVFDYVGVYRHMYANEDYDFVLRCIQKKINIGNIDQPLLKYRLNPKSISRSNLFEQQLVTYYLSKNNNDINEITEKSVTAYLDKIGNDKEKKQYLEAYRYAELSMKNNNDKIMFFYYKMKAIFSSRLYFKLNYLIKIKKKIREWRN